MRYLLLISLAFACLSLQAQPGHVYATVAQRKAFFTQLAAKYGSPAIREIFGSDKADDFEDYVKGHTEAELIARYGTIIHELLHGYDGAEMDALHYFISPNCMVKVPIGKYYNSKELNGLVRAGTQDSVFRYGLYIGGKSDLHGMAVDLNKTEASEVMSVQLGIYGIIEEYNAYYHDNQAVYELYEYYVKAYGAADKKAMSEYMELAEKGTVACYEFRLFVGWYLVFAKKKHPEIYQNILANKALRAVFTLVDDKYKALLHQIATRKESLKGKLEENAFNQLDFSGSDEDLYRFIALSSNAKEIGDPKKLDPMILREYKKFYQQFIDEMEGMDPGGNLRKFANTPQQIAYLKRLMTPEMKAAVDSFRVAGLKEDTWRQYVAE